MSADVAIIPQMTPTMCRSIYRDFLLGGNLDDVAVKHGFYGHELEDILKSKVYHDMLSELKAEFQGRSIAELALDDTVEAAIKELGAIIRDPTVAAKDKIAAAKVIGADYAALGQKAAIAAKDTRGAVVSDGRVLFKVNGGADIVDVEYTEI